MWAARLQPPHQEELAERLKERAFLNRPAADARIAQHKHEARNSEKVIERIFQGEITESAVRQPFLKAVCRAYESSKSCAQTTQTFFRLLRHTSRQTDFRGTQPVIPAFGPQEGNTFVAGLLALARHLREWIRPVETWKARTHNPHRQFSSLARHLFAQWPVPSFLDSVWFKGASGEAIRQQYWFMYLGAGFSVRLLDLPLPYTKKMAHHFLLAPPDITVEAAVRWGQIHGLGGNARLVRAILGTRLATNFEQDEFWTTILRFFINNPMLDHHRIGPIIDYIHYQKFVPQELFVAPGVVERREPPQPNFTMKGRTPESLVQQIVGWHRQLAHVKQPETEWPASGIAGFEYLDRSSGDVRIWRITELTSTRALIAEGRELVHCVATYAHSCLAGSSSIWSLEMDNGEKRSKVFTIEINPASRTICQMRGKRNVLPGERHLGILRRWAEQAGLRLANHV